MQQPCSSKRQNLRVSKTAWLLSTNRDDIDLAQIQFFDATDMCTRRSEICTIIGVLKDHEIGAAFAGGSGVFKIAEKLLKLHESHLSRGCSGYEWIAFSRTYPGCIALNVLDSIDLKHALYNTPT